MARILVIHDSHHQRLQMTRWLNSTEHEVVSTADGDEALGLLGNKSFELVITDLVMPEIGGLEILEEARKLEPPLPVVLLTQGLTPKIIDKLLAFGAAACLPKPLTRKVLLDTVDTLFI